MVVWPENWDFFIGPGCIFPTTAPITEATNGRKGNKPKQRYILYPLGSQQLSPPIPQSAVPAGPTAASVLAIATTLTGLLGLGCKRTGKQRDTGHVSICEESPFPLFKPELEGSSCLGAYLLVSGCLESRLGDNTGKAGRGSSVIWWLFEFLSSSCLLGIVYFLESSDFSSKDSSQVV